jgi:hypothetical protein
MNRSQLATGQSKEHGEHSRPSLFRSAEFPYPACCCTLKQVRKRFVRFRTHEGTNSVNSVKGERTTLHSSRKAAAIGSRDARMAGNNPPTKPISADQMIPRTSNSGVTLNAKATWLKLWKFIVEV